MKAINIWLVKLITLNWHAIFSLSTIFYRQSKLLISNMVLFDFRGKYCTKFLSQILCVGKAVALEMEVLAKFQQLPAHTVPPKKKTI